MKKILLALALAVFAVPAMAQYTPPPAAPFDGGAVGNPFLAPATCGTTPGFAFTGDADTGMCQDGANVLRFYAGAAVATNDTFFLSNGLFEVSVIDIGEIASLELDSTSVLGARLIYDDTTSDSSVEANATTGVVLDVNFAAGTNTLTVGPANTTSVDPFLTSVGTTTNKAFALSTDIDNGVYFGIGTQNIETGASSGSFAYVDMDGNDGIGTPRSILGANDNAGESASITCSAWSQSCIINTTDGTNSVTNSTTNDTISENFNAVDRRLVVRAPRALTSATATSVVQSSVPTEDSVGFTVHWTVQADDGTDFQSRRGSTYVAAVNKGSVETCIVGDIGTPIVAVSAGTLTVTATCSTAPANAVIFELDADSSLTETTLEVFYSVTKDDGIGVLTPQ